MTVAERPIEVTADDKSKAYGTSDPALTHSITSGSLAAAGDSLSGDLTRDPGEDVGDYDIKQGTLTAGPNYDLTFVGAKLRITPRPLEVTADPKSKVFGDPDPPLTYQITGGSLAQGDSLSGDLTRDPGELPGAYDIRQGTLTAGPNYDLAFIGAKLTITQSPGGGPNNPGGGPNNPGGGGSDPSSTTITVNKDFQPDNPAGEVAVSLDCGSGVTVTVQDGDSTASESDPVTFTVDGLTSSTRCSATEGAAPLGYAKDESDCTNFDPHSKTSCTIVNRLLPRTPDAPLPPVINTEGDCLTRPVLAFIRGEDQEGRLLPRRPADRQRQARGQAGPVHDPDRPTEAERR